MTAADGRGYTFNYDNNNQILRQSDLSGKVIETHTYAGNKAITSEISEGREKYTLAYDPLKTTVTDALGHVTSYDGTIIQLWQRAVPHRQLRQPVSDHGAPVGGRAKPDLHA
jgi:hypothetical protein